MVEVTVPGLEPEVTPIAQVEPEERKYISKPINGRIVQDGWSEFVTGQDESDYINSLEDTGYAGWLCRYITKEQIRAIAYFTGKDAKGVSMAQKTGALYRDDKGVWQIDWKVLPFTKSMIYELACVGALILMRNKPNPVIENKALNTFINRTAYPMSQ